MRDGLFTCTCPPAPLWTPSDVEWRLQDSVNCSRAWRPSAKHSRLRRVSGLKIRNKCDTREGHHLPSLDVSSELLDLLKSPLLLISFVTLGKSQT